MDLDKKYYDLDGDECNILDLVKCSPEWATNRIQAGEKAIDCLEKLKTNSVILPKELTAENGAKGLLIGDFFEEMRMECPVCGDFGNDPDCDGCDGKGHIDIKLIVSWTNIKAIYKRIVKYYTL